MKFTSELIKKAHELTKETREEFAEVDYKTQFGISLSYLLNNKTQTTTKALIIYAGYGHRAMIADVHKEYNTDYFEPNKFYRIDKMLLCGNKRQFDIDGILGEEFDYFDCVGTSTPTESYVCPITEKQAQKFILSYKPLDCFSYQVKYETGIDIIGKLRYENMENAFKLATTTKKCQMIFTTKIENKTIMEYIHPQGDIVARVVTNS